jgi:capsular polysaccharide biosynthesis protein/Mrp family chromosome partitioning ATPase
MNVAREFRRYIRVLWTWAWLIIAGALLAGAINYYITSTAAPRYEASATLMVGQVIKQVNPDQVDIGLADRLVVYYLELLRRQPVLDGVKQDLHLTIPNEVLVTMVGARVVPSTGFIELVVTDTDPTRVVQLVNTFSEELIKQSPTSPENTGQQQHDFVQKQLDDLQAKIEDGRKELAAFNQTLNTSTTAVEIAEARGKITAKQAQIDSWQASYIELLRTSNLSSPNSISVLESSNQARRVQTISPIISVMLAAGIGAILAIGCAILLEYLDDRIKSGLDIEARLKLAVLGHIPTRKGRKAKSKKGSKDHFNDGQPYLPNLRLRKEVVEAYEIISTSIMFSETLSQNRKSVLITSPSDFRQQADVVLDLAIALISFSPAVLLVDADTAQPRLHELLGLTNQPGFYEIFYGGRFNHLEDKVLETAIPNLFLIPAGLKPAQNQQITVLNGGTRRIYDLPQTTLPGDFAIFNCANILRDKTTRLLSSNISGTVLLCELKRTRGQELKAAVEVVERLHGQVIGVITLDHERRKLFGSKKTAQVRSEMAAAAAFPVNPAGFGAAPNSNPPAPRPPVKTGSPIITPVPDGAGINEDKVAAGMTQTGEKQVVKNYASYPSVLADEFYEVPFDYAADPYSINTEKFQLGSLRVSNSRIKQPRFRLKNKPYARPD